MTRSALGSCLSAGTTVDETTLDPTAASLDSTGDSSDDTESPLPPSPVTGIQIVDVTADQGIRIPVAEDGAYVEPAARNAELLQSRDTVIRGFDAPIPASRAALCLRPRRRSEAVT